MRLGEFSAIDIGVGLAEALPTGLYSGSGLDDYVEEVLADSGRVNDFRLLDPELYLTATDLDTCERIVFGEEGWRTCRSPKRSSARPACRSSTSRST